MKFNDNYSEEQKEWCREYEKFTTFEPLMGDFECGHESFEVAANSSVNWFESWSSDMHLCVSGLNIPANT